MRDWALTADQRVQPARACDAEVAFQMDEDTFRALYERTARPIWVYLLRMTGDAHAADDLLQETYYRFLRARADFRHAHSCGCH